MKIEAELGTYEKGRIHTIELPGKHPTLDKAREAYVLAQKEAERLHKLGKIEEPDVVQLWWVRPGQNRACLYDFMNQFKIYFDPQSQFLKEEPCQTVKPAQGK